MTVVAPISVAVVTDVIAIVTMLAMAFAFAFVVTVTMALTVVGVAFASLTVRILASKCWRYYEKRNNEKEDVPHD